MSDPADRHEPFDRLRPVDADVNEAVGGLEDRLAAIAFWCAIALPALYLPLLVVTDDYALSIGLLGAHLVALVGGRPHRTD